MPIIFKGLLAGPNFTQTSPKLHKLHSNFTNFIQISPKLHTTVTQTSPNFTQTSHPSFTPKPRFNIKLHPHFTETEVYNLNLGCTARTASSCITSTTRQRHHDSNNLATTAWQQHLDSSIFATPTLQRRLGSSILAAAATTSTGLNFSTGLEPF